MALPGIRRAASASAALMLTLGLAALAALPAPARSAPERQFVPPDELPHYPPERGYDLRHLRLELSFDFRGRTVAGTAVNTVVPLLSGTRSLTFHAAELAVTRVRLAGGGAELPFAIDARAQTLVVRLDRAYGPDDRLEVAIDYSAHPRAGLYFVGPDEAYPGKPHELFSQGEAKLNRYWFPSWDEPDPRATSELLATVERPYEVIGNGHLVEVLERADGRRTFHWRMEQPHSTYLVSVVAGEFSRQVDHWRGIPIESYVPRELAEIAPLAFAPTADMMDYFSTVTGRPYPYPRYAQVAVYDFINGGQENITATTLTTAILRDRRATADSTSETVVAHELAHQWFGDLITCRSWDHAWLNEGFASYFETLYRGHAGGEDEMALELDSFRRAYFGDDRDSYRRPMVTRRFPDADSIFDTVTYQKGALVLHMAHYLMGEEGWWKGIRLYVERRAGKTVTTQDLETDLEDASGVALGPLFDQYVYGAGHPELTVRWEYQAATGMVRLSVRQDQKIEEQTGLFSFPLEVALVGAGGARIERVPLRAETAQDLYVASAEPPRTVVVDPRGALIARFEIDKPDSEWIAQLAAGLPLAARLQAIRALGAGASPEGVEALGRVLGGKAFHGERAEAARALGEAGGAAALGALVSAVADPEPRVRAAVFTALGKFPDHPELIARLARALAGDESYGVRAAAAGALGRFERQGGDVATPLLAALGQPSFRERVRRAALGSLARLDNAEGYARAQQLLHYGNPPDSRLGALLALGTFATRSHDARRKEEARKAIEGCLGDRDYFIRLAAGGTLGEIGDPASIPALLRSARNEPESRQRRNREQAIRAIEDQQAESRLAGQATGEGRAGEGPVREARTGEGRSGEGRRGAGRPGAGQGGASRSGAAQAGTEPSAQGGSAVGIEDRLRQLERAREVLEEQVRELRQAPSGSGSTPAVPGGERPSAGAPAAPGAERPSAGAQADPGDPGSSGEAVKPPPLGR
jgi:aminopeptidase N